MDGAASTTRPLPGRSDGQDHGLTASARAPSATPPAAATFLAPSSYLDYLPAPYQGDAFLGRFLLIFESILSPIERTIDHVAYYFDAELTPAELLPWLATWIGLDLDEHWPREKQRALVGAAARLYRMRGTRQGLREHLQIYTGRPPLIVENFDGLRLGQDAALGINTRLGTVRNHCIFVTVFVDRPDEVHEPIVRRIIEAERPAHVGYVLEIRPAGI